jgi:hypothetical protein
LSSRLGPEVIGVSGHRRLQLTVVHLHHAIGLILSDGTHFRGIKSVEQGLIPYLPDPKEDDESED